MTIDLRGFIGETGRNRDILEYVIDGHEMPDSTGQFLAVDTYFAILHGSSFFIGPVPLVSGSLYLKVAADGTGTITVCASVGNEGGKLELPAAQDFTDQASFTYTVDGQVLKLHGSMSTLGSFDGSIQTIDNGQNTRLTCAFQRLFDGKTVTADLVPKKQ